MNKKQLTVAESACIITGYGIGGGVMAMPYLAQKNGVVVSRSYWRRPSEPALSFM